MATKKTAKAAVTEETASRQEAVTQSPVAVTSVQETAARSSVSVVICAYEGTEKLVKRLWDKFHKGVHKVVAVNADAGTRFILTECLADEDVADEFVLVPANIVPCAEISDELLKGRFVYVTRSGEKQYDSRVPLYVSKSELVECLAAEDSQTVTPEVFVRRLHGNRRLNEVSFAFGNFITPVLRANPCENVVIEAFVRKFFVSASPEGFNAIGGLLEQYLLKG